MTIDLGSVSLDIDVNIMETWSLIIVIDDNIGFWIPPNHVGLRKYLGFIIQFLQFVEIYCEKNDYFEYDGRNRDKVTCYFQQLTKQIRLSTEIESKNGNFRK